MIMAGREVMIFQKFSESHAPNIRHAQMIVQVNVQPLCQSKLSALARKPPKLTGISGLSTAYKPMPEAAKNNPAAANKTLHWKNLFSRGFTIRSSAILQSDNAASGRHKKS